MLNPFDLKIPTQVHFGQGIRRFAFELLKNEQWKNIGIIIDENLRGLEIFDELLEEFESNCSELNISNCGISEPTYDSLEMVRGDFCHSSLDAVIGIGGGSALDMAKAMAVLVHNDKPAISYRGFDQMDKPVLPIVAIPTTAGTGSEVTPNASFVDTNEKRKMGINGEAVRPKYAILDPELTLSCPLKPTISAAVDSIVHATEAYVAKKSNPIARFFAKEGFGNVAHALPLLLDDLNDLSLRSKVMYGAFLSGVALMHSGTGPAAALSYPLGVHYGVPHGIGGAIFLPSVVRSNLENGCYDYAGLIDGNENLSLEEKKDSAFAFLSLIESIFEKAKLLSLIPKIEIDFDLVVRETLQLGAALEQNPMPFDESKIRSVLEKLSRSF